MGFNESFDYEVFRREALAGVMERTVGMMHRCPIVPGEVYLITGGLPHAIGSGVFVQEIMGADRLCRSAGAALRRNPAG